MSLKRLIRRVGIVGIANGIDSSKALIILPIITKTMGEEAYGVWAQVIVTLSLLSNLILLGLNVGIVRYLAGEKDKNKIKSVFLGTICFVTFFGFFGALVLFFFSDIVANQIFHYTEASYFIKIISFGAVFHALSLVCLGYFRASEDIRKYSSFVILRAFLYIVAVAVGALYIEKMSSIFMGISIYTFLLFVTMFLIIVTSVGFKKPDTNILKSILSFSAPLLLVGMSGWIIHSSDRYMLSFFMNPTSVGLYSATYGIGSIILMVSAPLKFILYPTATRIWKEEGVDAAKEYFIKYLLLFIVISLPLLLFLSVGSEWTLKVLSTSTIASKGSSITKVIAISYFIYGVYLMTMDILTISKDTKALGLLVMISAIINVSLNLVLIPAFGVMGAALSTLICFTFLCLSTLYRSRKFMKITIKDIFSSFTQIFFPSYKF